MSTKLLNSPRNKPLKISVIFVSRIFWRVLVVVLCVHTCVNVQMCPSHRITKQFSIFGDHLVWTLVKAGAIKTACSRLHPVRLLISPRMEPPQPPWATGSSVWPLSSKNLLLWFTQNFLYFSMHIASLVVAGHHHGKRLAHLPYSFLLSSQMFKNIDKVPLQPFLPQAE